MLHRFRWMCAFVVGAMTLALASVSAMAQVKKQSQSARSEQSQPPPITELYPAGKVEFPSAPPPVGVAAGTQCDTNGNIYLQISPPYQVSLQLMRNHEPENLPLTKLSVDSKAVVTFRANSAPDYKGFVSVAFYVDPGGDVYNLATACRPGTDCKKPEDIAWLVTTYNDDGTVDGTVKLHAQVPTGEYLGLSHFAVFPDGNMLVVGQTATKAGGLRPFTAVFDRAGDFLANVTLPRDASPVPPPAGPGTGSGGIAHTPVPSASAKAKEAKTFAQFSRAVVEGRMVGSPDGTVYLLRGGSPERLYALGSDGSVLREQDIKTPRPGLMPFNVSVNGQGQFVIFYIGLPAPGTTSENQSLALVDPQTGKVVSTYKVPPNAGIPACMTNQGVVLFTRESKSGHLEVGEYTPE